MRPLPPPTIGPSAGEGKAFSRRAGIGLNTFACNGKMTENREPEASARFRHGPWSARQGPPAAASPPGGVGDSRSRFSGLPANSAGRHGRDRHGEAAPLPKPRGGRASPGREARALPWPRHCEAAKPPKQSSGAVPRVMGGRCHVLPCPMLDCFALACARARNDGGPPCRVPRVMGGRRRHRRGHRHCEAAQPPTQSGRAVRHVMGGRRTVLPRRFWIASPALRAGSL